MAVTQVRWRSAKTPKEYLLGLLRVAGSLWPHTSALGHNALVTSSCPDGSRDGGESGRVPPSVDPQVQAVAMKPRTRARPNRGATIQIGQHEKSPANAIGKASTGLLERHQRFRESAPDEVLSRRRGCSRDTDCITSLLGGHTILPPCA